MVGDCRTGALVSTTGDVDWLCLPRFDSASVFGALLGDERHGRWSLRPVDPDALATRAYRDDTMTLVTTWTSSSGRVEVVDSMPTGDGRADLVRRIQGVSGAVAMRTELRMRFDYAGAVPWVRQRPDLAGPSPSATAGHALVGIAGPDAVVVRGPRLTADEQAQAHTAEFTVASGEHVDLVLTWFPSHLDAPPALDVDAATAASERWWRDWAGGIRGTGVHDAHVRRSLLLLRALTEEDTGGIVAAATTSLPEVAGGVRNWDYRYVWLRDAALTLVVLIEHGLVAEAEHWRRWLLRAIAGDPADVQIMYGIAGERRLPEQELDSLPGHGGAAPVRIGNGAYRQFQADVVGEVMIALFAARAAGASGDGLAWSLQTALLEFAETRLATPDHGIWEVRGPERMFTHSRAMLWAAFDRGVRGILEQGLDGPLERWRGIRDALAAEIATHGVRAGAFVQHPDTDEVDAALLQLPQIGFCAWDDPRMLATVARIEATLVETGMVRRYRGDGAVDGLAGVEHPFTACSFWLVEQYARSGRLDDAEALMTRLVGMANDVGMFAEELDPATGEHWGNTPQALSHLALVRAAQAIADARP